MSLPQPSSLPPSRPDSAAAMESQHRDAESMPSASTRPQPRRAVSRKQTAIPDGSGGAALTRVSSTNSAHAGQSLRRMATHETGEFVERQWDGAADELDTHHEHDEDDSDRDHDRGKVGHVPNAEPAKDEEAVIGAPGEPRRKKKFELQDQTNLLPVKQVMVIFAGLNAALFCSLLDQTIVTTALPTLGRVFNAASISSWVGTAYMLTSTALQPVYGRLSDIFGRKAVLLGSLVIFLLGSLACALARTMIQLIIFRAIQGLGGGGILTLSMIIISDVVSLKDRGKYQGITGGVVAIANSVGPILGGIFTEKVSWRWCFYINLPLTGLAILVVFLFLPLKKVHGSMTSKLKNLDYYGSVLTLAWALLVLIALSWAGVEYAWSSAAVIAPLVIGVVLLGVFIYVEAKLVKLPLVPMYIFRNVTVAASMATTFCNGAAFYATLYYLPQYFQVVRGETPIRSGVDMLPLTFVQVFCSFFSGFLVSKTGDYKWNLMAGFFIWTIGLGLMSMLTPDTPKAHIYGFQVLIGVGAGQTFQTSLLAIQASVDRKDMATATGCRNFLRMLGGTVALAACAAIVNNVARQNINQLGLSDSIVDAIISAPTELVQHGLSEQQIAVVRSAYAKGIDGCFYLSVPMAGISFFITVFFIERVPLKREDDEKLKAEAKAWVKEQKKHKHEKHGHHDEHGTESSDSPPSERTLADAGSKAHAGVEPRGEHKEAALDDVKDDAESAARGMEQAAGVMTEKRQL